MFRISAKRSDVQDVGMPLRSKPHKASQLSVRFVKCLDCVFLWVLLFLDLNWYVEGHTSQNIFTLTHSSFSYPFLIWLMYSTVFFPGAFYKALHSFPKHFSSLQLLIEWNKFCLANYPNRCEFILHISHSFSWIFLHSMNYSWSRIDGWPKQQHVIVNNMHWQPNTIPETTKNIFEEGVSPQIMLCNSW